MKRDSLEGSAHTPMYNPNILPLIFVLILDTQCQVRAISKVSNLLFLSLSSSESDYFFELLDMIEISGSVQSL